MVKHPCPFEDCTSTFSRPYRLRIHIQRHQGIKEFKCTQCDHAYHQRQHLQRHVAEAHQNISRLEQPLYCDHCDRQFNTAWGLRRHQAKIKKPSVRVRQHRCETCGRKFFNTDGLKLHSLKHDRFKCNVPSCTLMGHTFTWSCYRRHMANYHSKLYTCDHCGDKFFIKAQIRQHVKEHMPNFTCTQLGCGKTFAELRYMSNHIRSCHGERRYKCSVIGCNWDFKYKVSLDKHTKVHQQNGRINSIVKKIMKNEPKSIMANKLAALALKIN